VTSNQAEATINQVKATQDPHMTLTKSASPTSYSKVGDVINYTLVATNDGNVTLHDVSIVDAKLGELTCTQTVDAKLGELTCTPPVTLAPGASLTCTGSHTVTLADLVAGSFANTATASGSDPQGQLVSATASKTVPAAPTPALSLTKSASPMSYSKVGDVINYTLVATNDANVTLHDVSIVDVKLGELTCTQTVDAKLGELTCTPPVTLAPGAALTCTGSHTVTLADLVAGSFANTATASGSDPQGQPVSATASKTVPAAPTPALSLTKSASPMSYSKIGQVIVYTYIVKNTGNVTLSGPFNINDNKLGTFHCSTATSLAPNASISCTKSYTIQAADIKPLPNSITNTATATGTFGTTPETSNQAQATIMEIKATQAIPRVFLPLLYNVLHEQAWLPSWALDQLKK
jgi:hypothetical protein